MSAHPEPKYFCEPCNESFFGKGDLTDHNDLCHGKEFECKFCDIKFKHKATRASHIETTHKSESHICGICSKVFKKRSDIQAHMKRHSDEPLYTNLNEFEADVHINTLAMGVTKGDTEADEALSSHVLGASLKGVTEERLARTEAGGRLKRKKDKNQNHGARDQYCLISKRLQDYKMAANTRSRDRNDGLYKFWREKYVRMDSCFLPEINKKISCRGYKTHVFC